MALEKAEPNSFFETLPKKIFWPSELVEVFRQHRTTWKMPRSMSPPDFNKWLLQHTKMRMLELSCQNCPSITRYVWGKGVSPVLVALSTGRHSYLSHGSAVWAHGLGGSDRDIYVNQEQREKPPNTMEVTQERIDQAFKNAPRHTKLIYELGTRTITILNGKFTNRLAFWAGVAHSSPVLA